MFTKPTAFVLGAGASAPFGYPIGKELVSQIVVKAPQQKGYFGDLPEEFSYLHHVEPLIHRLDMGDYSSVDAYLEGKTGPLVKIGKYLMAAVLKHHEQLERFSIRHDRDWYGHLFREIALDGEFDPQASFVTFNYDRSLEAFLLHVFHTHFELSHAEALTKFMAVPIVHVHGALGQFPSVPYMNDASSSQLFRQSQEIKIIGEVEDRDFEFASPDFRAANKLISEAEHIVFLGFGFHSRNVSRLKVEWAETKEYSWTFQGTGKEREDTLGGLEDTELAARLSGVPHYRDCEDLFRNTRF